MIPRAYDRRIEVQSGSFLMTSLQGPLSESNIFTNQTFDSEVELILVDFKLKAPLRSYLASKGLTEQTLFPSIEKFSEENSVDAPVSGAF